MTETATTETVQTEAAKTQTLKLDLVSPEKLLMSKDVEMVIIPATEGDMGVLPGHAPIIANLRPGTITVFRDNAVEERIFVAGGFVEVNAGGCIILAETAIPVSTLEVAAVQTEVSNLRDDVKVPPGDAVYDAEMGAAEASLIIAEAKLEAVQAPAYS